MTIKTEKKKLSKSLSDSNLWISIAFYLLTMLMPVIINVNNLSIYDSLYASIENNDQGLLIITSFKLVLMNAIRILPLYMSSYVLVVFLRGFFEEKDTWIYMILGVAIIPITYFTLDWVAHVHYDFGITSIVMMFAILMLVQNDFENVVLVKKASFFILLIIGLQWVDIIPFLTPYGFGQGEVSFDVKQAARFMGAEEAVTLSAFLFVVIFLSNAFMILNILRDQNIKIKTMEATSQMEIELREAKLQSLKSRSLEEMQNLVHDLKSPLTSIQALVSLSEMMVENEKVSEYMGKIDQSVDQLNVMITEILHENKKHRTTIDDLMRSVLSHLSSTVDENMISFDNYLAHGSIEINKIRFTRMMINLIDNSLNAIAEDGWIRINIYELDDYLIFEIIDNGRGMDEEMLEKIREPGFSSRGSSGIGLRYVEDVIGNHGGTVRFESTVDIGTRVTLSLNKECVGYEEDTGN